MEVEVRNPSGATKIIRAESRVARDGRLLVLATWSMAGDCYVDLGTGELLALAMPIQGGFYEVDLETGRLVGSAWRVPMAELDNLERREIGADIPIEHAWSAESDKVQIVDVELSRGRMRVMAKTGRASGRCLKTGWCVTASDLARLRGANLKRVA